METSSTTGESTLPAICGSWNRPSPRASRSAISCTAGYAAWGMPWHAVGEGRAARRGAEAVPEVSPRSPGRATNDPCVETIRLEQQFVMSLKGATLAPTSFDDGTFDEAACVRAYWRRRPSARLTLYYVMKQQVAFLYGRLRGVARLRGPGRRDDARSAVAGLPTTSCFYRALHAGRALPEGARRGAAGAPRTLEQERQKLERWASNCPENFQNRYALVSAEVARIEGRDLDAMRLYEEAIRSARENGFVHNEALAYELAAGSTGPRARPNGVAHLRNARAGYVRWGADGKVKQLDRLHPHLVESRPLASTATVAMRPEQLDLHSVTKASQTISGEIVLDKLLRTLLAIVLEQGGARAACLMLRRGETLSIEAEADPRCQRGRHDRSSRPAPVELLAARSRLRWSTTCTERRSASS